MSSPTKILEVYIGKRKTAQKFFLIDSDNKSKNNYYPISEAYENGSWGNMHFFAATISVLAVYFLVILVFHSNFSAFIANKEALFISGGFASLLIIYMSIVKPIGQLIVTYQYKEPEVACRNCGEVVKEMAIKCKHCRSTL